jgi:kynurenine formamidase
MQKIVDLSGVLENGLWGYHELPGLERIVPPVEVATIATVEKNDFFASKITVSTISGTYLEAGSHILRSGKSLDEYGVADFVKPVKIVKLEKQKSRALITGEMLEDNAPKIDAGEALIVDTGWGGMWNRPGYVRDCPNMAKSAIDWVLNKRVSIFGVDVPCIESAWSENAESGKGGLLGALFKQGVLLVAPLVNLDKVEMTEGTLVCLPMNVKGVSGAPARVIFIQD